MFRVFWKRKAVVGALKGMVLDHDCAFVRVTDALRAFEDLKRQANMVAVRVVAELENGRLVPDPVTEWRAA